MMVAGVAQMECSKLMAVAAAQFANAKSQREEEEEEEVAAVLQQGFPLVRSHQKRSLLRVLQRMERAQVAAEAEEEQHSLAAAMGLDLGTVVEVVQPLAYR
jgi:hypothetical protein